MNDAELWQTRNEQYLAAGLEWLRCRLGRLAAREAAQPAPQPAPAPLTAPPLAARAPWRSRWRGGTNPVAPAATVQPAPLAPALMASAAPSEEAEAAARAAMDATAEGGQTPAMLILGQRFGLSRFEQEILLLCAAMELDQTLPEKCARIDARRPYPTFALALNLFDDAAWDALSPEGPLRYWRLVEINQPPNEPLTTSGLRLDERILNYIKGLNYVDDRLRPFIAPLAAGGRRATLARSQEAAVAAIGQHLRLAAGWERPPVIQLAGADSESKQLVAAAAAAGLNMNIFRLPVGLLPAQVAELETFARLWERESLLLPLALLLDASEVDNTTGEQGGALARFLSRANGIFWVDTPQARADLGRNMAVVNVARPEAVEQREAWAAALGRSAGHPLPTRLAGQFSLNLPTIEQVASAALAAAELAGAPARGTNGAELGQAVWEICLARTSPQLGGLAQRLEPKATWDDITLPEPEMRLLRQIAGQVGQRSRVYDEWGFRGKMNRGFGINALFTGESGTGKTMAAEVLANELRLHLYRIDLASVVSKYIGETEKNLRRLFDAAEDGGAILFFDEADALFGKRSEVKDSHDRYANIEINYLLQRIEAYHGLAILATNMKNGLDPAFLRRLRFIVQFPFPGIAERRRIWSNAFPPALPTHGLDYDWLARLNLAGGSIHNVAINAAFAAAQMGEPVTMPVVLDVARAEFRKLERPINESDLRWNGAGVKVG
jgi:hypothetical protein